MLPSCAARVPVMTPVPSSRHRFPIRRPAACRRATTRFPIAADRLDPGALHRRRYSSYSSASTEGPSRSRHPLRRFVIRRPASEPTGDLIHDGLTSQVPSPSRTTPTSCRSRSTPPYSHADAFHADLLLAATASDRIHIAPITPWLVCCLLLLLSVCLSLFSFLQKIRLYYLKSKTK
uniref:Uncharacterized protein n=1 Tax=Oryza punctata TaxID=4537 RepID=A0A0E0K548_ORYPU